jgi:hypothetical protein
MLEKIKKWFKKNWLFILNPVIIAIAYSHIFEKGFTGIEVLLALTLMANIGYWGYVLFSGKKVCKCKCPKCGTQFPCNCEV